MVIGIIDWVILILVAVWLFGLGLHIAGLFINLLIVLAVILLVVRFCRR